MPVNTVRDRDTLYQAEIAHPSIRGRLTTLQQFMLGIGALIASFIGYGCYHGLSGQVQWRLPLGAFGATAVHVTRNTY